MGIYVTFYHDHSPIMVMSPDPGYKFRKFYFSPNYILNFRESYQIWGKLAQEQKCYRQKNKTQGGRHPIPSVLKGLNNISQYNSALVNK